MNKLMDGWMDGWMDVWKIRISCDEVDTRQNESSIKITCTWNMPKYLYLNINIVKCVNCKVEVNFEYYLK